MADLIQLLPDAIANKIAAGEVVQRPASVVKELLENAVDAGASAIRLMVKDAGKTLIQVVDDGCGMSETDARMSFERHATSKIRQAEDLMAIRTMGFRGEALASIAAVAQVDMRTRKKADELGTRLLVEGSALKKQEPCQTAPGTSIAVKNLFFNVPARRNFLKSDTAELKHITEEFQRVALANPDLHFSFFHQDKKIQHLPPGNLRQRIINVFGANTNKKLVPVQEETDIVTIRGFVGKPEYARKTRGEQYFFVNDRFIKSGYLNHAVVNAYDELLPEDSYPLYVLYVQIDPQQIDINVHPTKQEIKFADEKLVYNYLRVAVRHALGQHNITPTLDFEQEQGLYRASVRPISGSQAGSGGYAGRPKEVGSSRAGHNLKNWEKLYEGLGTPSTTAQSQGDQDLWVPPESEPDDTSGKTVTLESDWPEEDSDQSSEKLQFPRKEPYQIHRTYIVSQIKSGFLLIDQQSAHERILYESYLEKMQEASTPAQRQLFPRTIHLSAADAQILRQIREEIQLLGFDIADFGQHSFVLNGLPASLAGQHDEKVLIDSLLEQYKMGLDMKLDVRENIARAMARSAAIKRGELLQPEEMQQLIDQLFACSHPYKSPSGRNCFLTFELDALAKQFS